MARFISNFLLSFLFLFVFQCIALVYMYGAEMFGDKPWSGYNVMLVSIGLTVVFLLVDISKRLSDLRRHAEGPDDGRRRAP